MKIFVTGATGYLGTTVAERLREAGHQVIALARSDASAEKLERHGCEVVRGDLRDEEALRKGAAAADAVIHMAYEASPQAAELDRATVATFLDALADTGKPFIYTGSCWTHGDTEGKVADEKSPLHPIEVSAWRPAVEEAVLGDADRVHGIVIRPAIVYGRGGGIPAMLAESARERGAARYVGDGENRWPTVHVDDLADLYVLALGAPAGTLLIAAHGPSVKVKDAAEAASEAAGKGGKTESWPLAEARQALGPFADGLVLDQQLSGAKAEELLDWEPNRPSLLEELRQGSYA